MRFLLLGLLTAALPISAQSQTATTITLNPSSLGRTIPSTFSGISIETYSALDLGTTKYPSTNGPANVPADAWFMGGSSANASQKLFGTVLQTIGIKSLRFGGTTCEKPTYLVSGGGSNPNAIYPPLYDEEYVASFAQQYGMQLIWCIPSEGLYNVNTYESYIANAVAAQKSAGQNFQFVVEVGNEADNSGMSQSTYNSEFDAYLGAMRSDISTSIQFEGADGGGSFATGLMADPNYDSTNAPWHGNIANISRHTYISGESSQSSVDAAINTMLAPQASTLQSNWSSFGPKAVSLGYNSRISETNSFSGGGYNGASNAFAAALWGLDFMEYYSHSTSLTGVNFHVGATGQFYSPFMPQNLSSSYTLQGLGYGMLAFHTDGAGQVVPTTVSGNGSSLNLTAYGTYLSDGSETAIVINKTSVIAGTNTNVTLTVEPGKTYSTAAVYYLQAPNNDPAQTSGMTFGGTEMSSTAGTWSGSPTLINANSNGTFTIPLSYSEAAVVHMT
ncbi:MAG TPA: glycosyl hydrolase family 79 C-terminal domain-containing protein, partial [Acidobacteriaceae bacterium]|nr:glycosyl hydrolase family 79 C-terminal domain-containing protein [Acidobacteriaceae bacterium]